MTRAVSASSLRSPFGLDIMSPLTADQYVALFGAGCSWVGHYLGHVSAQNLADLTGAGLAFLPIAGFARIGDWSSETGLADATATITTAKSLALPSSITIWLDLESDGMTVEAATAYATVHAHAIASVGDLPGLYAGAGCPLDGAQLYALPHVAYAQACSAGYTPPCGFQWLQQHPGDQACHVLAGERVDWGMLAQDYRGRWPVLVAA